MPQVPPDAAGNHPAGELIELERQEKNLVFHLQRMFLESDYNQFDRANEALSEVREKNYTILLKREANAASDNESNIA